MGRDLIRHYVTEMGTIVKRSVAENGTISSGRKAQEASLSQAIVIEPSSGSTEAAGKNPAFSSWFLVNHAHQITFPSFGLSPTPVTVIRGPPDLSRTVSPIA
jgi:hypothetical protein